MCHFRLGLRCYDSYCGTSALTSSRFRFRMPGSLPWSQYNGNERHDGQSPFASSTELSNASVLFSFDSSSLAPGCVVGSASMLYCVCGSIVVCSVDGMTGSLRWHNSLMNDTLFNMPALSSNGSALFVVDQSGRLFALSTDSGALLWSGVVPNWIVSDMFFDSYFGTMTVGSDNTLYLLAPSRVVRALDGWSGTQKWSTTLGGSGISFVLPLPAIDGGIAYIGFGDSITALNITTGTTSRTSSCVKWESTTMEW